MQVTQALNVLAASWHYDAFIAFSRYSIKVASLNGLRKTPTTPHFSSRARSTSSQTAVTKTIGICRPAAISRSCRSAPLMPGSCRSLIRQKVAGERPDRRYSSADANVAASYPNDRMRSSMALRTIESSSTTEIKGRFDNCRIRMLE